MSNTVTLTEKQEMFLAKMRVAQAMARRAKTDVILDVNEIDELFEIIIAFRKHVEQLAATR